MSKKIVIGAVFLLGLLSVTVLEAGAKWDAYEYKDRKFDIDESWTVYRGEAGGDSRSVFAGIIMKTVSKMQVHGLLVRKVTYGKGGAECDSEEFGDQDTRYTCRATIHYNGPKWEEYDTFYSFGN